MKKGFDYVALGHIHKHMIFGDGNIVYPGSMINTSFKEGKTGMIIGEFENYSIVRMNTNHQNGYNVNEGTKVRIEHINLDPIKYETLYMNISDISSKEDELDLQTTTPGNIDADGDGIVDSQENYHAEKKQGAREKDHVPHTIHHRFFR